jgi:hypothetical protein
MFLTTKRLVCMNHEGKVVRLNQNTTVELVSQVAEGTNRLSLTVTHEGRTLTREIFLSEWKQFFKCDEKSLE